MSEQAKRRAKAQRNARAEGRGLPVVAIVGRPNVGKSTLLNRIIGRREAIVQELPGVTRDRKIVDAEWNGRDFQLVDTGGWLPGGSDLDAKVSRQAEQAVAGADLVLLVVDVVVGVTAEDAAVAEWLRRGRHPVVVVANKVDSDRREAEMWAFVSLGLGDPWPVSAIHGRGTGDLLDEVVRLLPAPAPEEDADGVDADGSTWVDGRRRDGVPGVAIVGRPNVGKSTLFNQLIGEDRAVVHDMPGTTRDTVDTEVETDLGRVRFVDTAGMRRRSRVDDGTEYYSTVRALQAVDAADIALLVIDATEGVTHQDQRLAERVDAAGCPVVVILNKWELMDAEGRVRLLADVADKLRFLPDPPVLRITALSGKGVQKLFPLLGETIEHYRTRIPTREVNKAIQDAQVAHSAPGGARVLYATQGTTDPPTFTLFTNRELPRTYLRYLENQLRARFSLGAVPVELRVRRRS